MENKTRYEIRFFQGDDLWLGGEAGWYIAEIEKDRFGDEDVSDTFGPFGDETEAESALKNKDFLHDKN